MNVERLNTPATLKSELIGAWELVSYEERPVDGSPSIYPMGEEPKGLIMYTPDGYMSAQLMHPERQPFSSGDWFNGTREEYEMEATSYIAYSGRFHVDETKRTLSHSMFVSLFPNWIGQTQPRVVRLEDDSLFLSTASPIVSGGRQVMSYLEWRRADQDPLRDAPPGRGRLRAGSHGRNVAGSSLTPLPLGSWDVMP